MPNAVGIRDIQTVSFNGASENLFVVVRQYPQQPTTGF
jgi:hypothetical protein